MFAPRTVMDDRTAAHSAGHYSLDNSVEEKEILIQELVRLNEIMVRLSSPAGH